MNRYAVIMAAGKGTRMKSLREDMSKVSFPVLGRPMVAYVLKALESVNPNKIVTIVGFGGEMTKSIVSSSSEVVWQKEQKGTGHAVMMASPILEKEKGQTIICCGDTPLLKGETLQKMFAFHEESHNDLTVMTALLDDPTGYGRIVKKDGRVIKIVEQKDATEEEKAIKEINAGVYIFDNETLFADLKKLTPNNAQGEYYLTDVISMFVKEGKKVDSFIVDDVDETMGVNDRYQLSIAAKIMQERINSHWTKEGVSIEDSASTYIGPDVKIGQDTIIKPNTSILGHSEIGETNILGPDLQLEDVKMGSRNQFRNSVIIASTFGDDLVGGPYLYIDHDEEK